MLFQRCGLPTSAKRRFLLFSPVLVILAIILLSHHAQRSARTVGIVRYCSGTAFAGIANLSEHNSLMYSQTHGYNLYKVDIDSFPLEPFVHPKSWVKVAYIYQLLSSSEDSKLDWVISIDCDALFHDLHKSFEDLLLELGGDTKAINIIAATDLGIAPFNAGVLFVRNTPWSIQFLAKTLQRASENSTRYHGWWEQMAMMELFNQNANGEQDHIMITPTRSRINAFAHLNDTVENTYIWHRVMCHEQPKCDKIFLAKYAEIHG